MSTSQTRVILIFINVLALSLFANALSDLFPVDKLSTFEIVTILVGLLIVGLFTAQSIERLDHRTADPQKLGSSAQSEMPNLKPASARKKNFITRWWEKFLKWMILWRDSIRKSRKDRARYVVLIAGVVTLLVWFITQITNNRTWEKPSNYSQAEWLENAVGWNYDRLAVRLGHFGAESSGNAEPHTILLRAGFGDSLFTMRELGNYLTIMPTNVARNDLFVQMAPANSAATLKASLEELSRKQHAKKVSEHPPVYALELYAKTSGNEQPFMRTYHFRERTAFEVRSFMIGGVLLLLALGLFLEIPRMRERGAAYNQLSRFFRKLLLIALRVIKIAASLKYNVARIIEELTPILSKSIKIFEDTDQKREPPLAPLLKKHMQLMREEFDPLREATLDAETAAKLQRHVITIFRIIEIVDHIVIIVHDDPASCQKLLTATAASVDEAHARGEKLAAEYNARIRELRDTHARERDRILAEIQKDIRSTFGDEDFRKLLDDFINQRGKYMLKKKGFAIKRVRGEGYGGLEIEVELPSIASDAFLPIELKRQEEKCLISAQEEIRVAIPAPIPSDEANLVAYKLRLSALTLTPPYEVPENLAQFLSLEPADPETLNNSYKEKSLDDFEA